MSDRCYVEVTCRKRDAARFEKLGFKVLDDGNLEGCVLADLGLGTPSEDKDSGLVSMHDEQANYGHYGEMPKDIPYFGWHGPGGEYGPCRFACDGKKYLEVDASQDGEPVVHVSEGGKVDKRHLKQVMAYQACLMRAMRALRSRK